MSSDCKLAQTVARICRLAVYFVCLVSVTPLAAAHAETLTAPCQTNPVESKANVVGTAAPSPESPASLQISQTPGSLPADSSVKSAASPSLSGATPLTSTVSPTASGTTTPPSSATPIQSSSRGDTGSAASIDNFIPGSEMLPPETTTTATTSTNDDFVKTQKPTMDLALLLYKSREYRQSVLVLEKLPQTEQTRYYMGLCYKSLGNQRDATTQFAWLAYYAKDPRYKNGALAAIRGMRPLRPAQRPRGESTSTKFSSAEARQRSEEIVARTQAALRNRAAREGN